MQTKTNNIPQINHALVIQRDGQHVLLNYKGKPVRTDAQPGPVFRYAMISGVKVVNENSEIGKAIRALAA